MRLLLDTHVILWFQVEPHRLSQQQVDALESPLSELWVSSVSAFEIAQKVASGKLTPTAPVSTLIQRLQLNVLALSVEHAEAAAALPPIHRDPFDRMLVAQARLEGMTLVTSDPHIRQYSVACL